MSARSKARKRALDMLFAADVRAVPVATVLTEEAVRAAGEPSRESSWLYAREIVDGITDHASEIDEAIRSAVQGWTLERMPNVDRALLRIATWEILYNPDVPTSVAINEAVEAAKLMSTDESPAFIHGVLGSIASR